MTDQPDRPSSPGPSSVGPATPVAERRRRRRGVVSAVWLVPIVAVLIAVAIAWQSWSERGVLISIAFPDASGVTVGQTTLRYREVTVGVVEDVGFTADLSRVNVYVRVNQDIAPYMDEDASFWIVQPEVTARGVQGLNTILSGTYIEGTWGNEIANSQTSFVGDERAPIIPPGVDGTAITLRAKDSSRLGPGAPILFRGIEVGEVATPRLSTDGSEVRVDAFILAPYDRQLSTATRFWDASGVSASLGTSGVELRIGSIASILEGGLNFDTLISGGDPIDTGYLYNIFDDETAARASAFEAVEARSIALGALFPSAVSGLAEGASVRYRGVRVGSVTGITGFIDSTEPSGQVQLLAGISLQPSKMGLEGMRNDVEGVDFIADLVQGGMRAQLVSTSLLGGELAIDLVDDPDALPGVTLEIGLAANPLIPTLDSEITGLTASAESVLERINDLPIEELLASATDLLDNVNRIAADEATRAIPGEVVTLLEESGGFARDARSLLASPQVAGVLADVEAITGDLRGVTADIAERELATTVADALDAATAAARNIAAGTENLDALAGSAQTVLDGVGSVVSSEDTQAIPGLAREALQGARDVAAAPELAAILSDTAAATADLRALVEPFDGTSLAATIERVLTSIDATAANVAEGTDDLRSLRVQIDGVVAAADALLASADTQAIPGAARGLLEDGRAIVAGPEVQILLTNLAATTADIRAITARLAAEDAGGRLTEALNAAAAAATSLSEGTANLPDLSSAAGRVLAQAETLGANLNELSLKANALALDELVDSTAALMRTADAFLSSDDADDIPVALVDTLEELRLTIETIRTGGTLENLNSTLSSTSAAADGIRVAATDLPALVARLQGLATDAGTLLGTYSNGSRVNTELFAALRAATRAAEDVSSLSRTIERNPNSLLLGR